eukprot:1288194-Lingulodinium_polyedra.AAC.1
MGSQAAMGQQAAAGVENYVETNGNDEEVNMDDEHQDTRHASRDPIAIPVGDTSDDDDQVQGGPPLPPPGIAPDRPGDTKKR